MTDSDRGRAINIEHLRHSSLHYSQRQVCIGAADDPRRWSASGGLAMGGLHKPGHIYPDTTTSTADKTSLTRQKINPTSTAWSHYRQIGRCAEPWRMGLKQHLPREAPDLLECRG